MDFFKFFILCGGGVWLASTHRAVCARVLVCTCVDVFCFKSGGKQHLADNMKVMRVLLLAAVFWSQEWKSALSDSIIHIGEFLHPPPTLQPSSSSSSAAIRGEHRGARLSGKRLEVSVSTRRPAGRSFDDRRHPAVLRRHCGREHQQRRHTERWTLSLGERALP